MLANDTDADGDALSVLGIDTSETLGSVTDNGDGTYKNPILHADYSDPDVVRNGDNFYMVSSSFNCAPGLPVLHSKDLVNWTIVNHVFQKQVPESNFDKPQHGNGTSSVNVFLALSDESHREPSY